MSGVISPAVLRDWKLPAAGGSKHARGHVVVVGGSRTTPGAVLLAGIAALRVGAGVLALAVPEPVAIPLAVAVPEAMVQPLGDDTADLVADASAVLVGPGFADPESTRAAMTAVLPHLADDTRLVLDAFSLGVLPDLADLVEPFRAGWC